jgi:hypothetical protein
MYAVEDATFRRARSLVAALAQELSALEESGSRSAADLRELVRRSADSELPKDGEAAYVAGLAADLARLFSVEEMFPRKRRARQ